jgi:hypothetical protein
MKVEIVYTPEHHNYSWKLYTGPADLSDEYNGVCSSLGECFEDIIKWNFYNDGSYFDSIDT